MDGTLLDSMMYWRQIGSVCLEHFGKKPQEKDFDRCIYRMKEEDIIRTFAKYGIHFQNRKEYVETYYQAIRPYYDRVQPMPGVVDFLREMKAKGVRMCVATATRTDISIPVLERLDMLQWFDFVLCCDDVKAGKDKPDIYLEAARRMGLPVSETAVFEDALYCVKTTKKAGFYTVGVLDPTAEISEIEGVKALSDRYIKDYRELLEVEECAG